MTVPNEDTAVALTKLTAAFWNKNVRDAINFLLNPPTAEVRQTSIQSIPNTGPTAVTLDFEDVDTDTMHDPAVNPSRLTFVTAGRYQISGAGSLAANATGTVRQVRWRVNGADLAGGMGASVAPGAGVVVLPARTMTHYFNVGDYLELFLNHDATAAINTVIAGATAQSSVTARYMGNT